MASTGTKRRRSGERIELRCLGFCGADDSVEPGLLAAISATYPWVEWGVLFREDKAGQPRYASAEWLKRLGAVNSARAMRLAGHLCAERVDQLLRGDTSYVEEMHTTVGFQRFQVNATAANNADVSLFADDAGTARCIANIRAALEKLPKVEFILQRNSQTRALWEPFSEETPSNLSLLYDDSMGLGKCSESWPPPPPLACNFGYAGGLAPHNLRGQLAELDKVAAGRTLWVDMESSLRTKLLDGTDIFDCNKAMTCVRHVVETGLEPSA